VTDRNLIGKKLAHIRSSVEEIRTLRRPATIHDERVDLSIIENIVTGHLDDFFAFGQVIQQRLESC
jgi:uncharacterized protein YutE (UPF0331/DUF86 family)